MVLVMDYDGSETLVSTSTGKDCAGEKSNRTAQKDSSIANAYVKVHRSHKMKVYINISYM